MADPIYEVRTFIRGKRALYGEFTFGGNDTGVVFRGEAEVKLDLPNGEEQTIPFRFPFEGVEPKSYSNQAVYAAVDECFLHWEEHAKKAAEAMKAEFMEHIAKAKAAADEMARHAKAAADAGKPLILQPVHDPTLPERHLDRDGNEKPRRRIIT
jgi:hypothetical protein